MGRKIAVDVVLLLPERITSLAIETNRNLLKGKDNPIILDKKTCLPHISLAMGCIDEDEIKRIEKTMDDIRHKNKPLSLVINGAYLTSSTGFSIDKNSTLQKLHEDVMNQFSPFFTYVADADSFRQPPKTSKETIGWVNTYKSTSSFENFNPHITIGYGTITKTSFPISFTALELALCHLGNKCICKNVLIRTKLGK